MSGQPEEERSHTFVVQVWVEGQDADGDPVLRAYIAHVLYDDREHPHAMHGIDDIGAYIARYAVALGVPLDKMRWSPPP